MTNENRLQVNLDPYHMDEEVYFSGRRSVLSLIPPLLKGIIFLAIAYLPVFFLEKLPVQDWLLAFANADTWTLLVRNVTAGTLNSRDVVFMIGALFLAVGVIVVIKGFLNWVSTRFRVTNQRIEYESGVIAKSIHNVELWRVQEILYNRTVIQFFFRLGSVDITAKDADIPELRIGPITGARKLYDKLKQARLVAGRRAGPQAMLMGSLLQ